MGDLNTIENEGLAAKCVEIVEAWTREKNIRTKSGDLEPSQLPIHEIHFTTLKRVDDRSARQNADSMIDAISRTLRAEGKGLGHIEDFQIKKIPGERVDHEGCAMTCCF